MIFQSNFLFALFPLVIFMTPVIAAVCGLVPPPPPQAVANSGSGSGCRATPQAGNRSLVASGWYAGWDVLPPSQISWDKYTALTFSFATTSPDPSTLDLDSTSASLLPTFVQEAHNHNVAALVSIGGWDGSVYYSTAVGNAENRTTFVATVVGFAQQYNLDGIDFDWEYPGQQGMGSNTVSTSDSANFLSFLQQLRQNPVGSKLRLTAAVGLAPFTGSDGNPMTDVSSFASVLDLIAIMDYDVWGCWSSGVGPNAPLNDSCAPVQAGSATSALKAWTSAGFPASQASTHIVLGVAAYGHSFPVTPSAALDSSGSLVAYPPITNSTTTSSGQSDSSATSSTSYTGCASGEGSPDNSGLFTFSQMISTGFLDSSGSPAQGIEYRFDNCSQTPFVYNSNSQVMISYDNGQSFAAKGKFIKDNGMAGFAIWEISGDSNDILLSSISDAMSVVQPHNCS